MLQNPVRATDLEFPDQREVLPSPSSSIVHLGFQIAQLGLLCLAHHLQQFTTQFDFFQIKTKNQSSFSECLFSLCRFVFVEVVYMLLHIFSDLFNVGVCVKLDFGFCFKKSNGVGLDGDSRLTLTQHKYIHPFSAFAIFGGRSHISILESRSNSRIITNFIILRQFCRIATYEW